MFYQNYSNVFVILDYEITADSAVYLFTQNYTQTAISCGDNKQLISIEMALLFNSGKVTSLLGKIDGLSYVTP